MCLLQPADLWPEDFGGLPCQLLILRALHRAVGATWDQGSEMLISFFFKFDVFHCFTLRSFTLHLHKPNVDKIMLDVGTYKVETFI